MNEEKSKPVFDRDYALEITDGDTEFLKELADLFNADYPQKLVGISRAMEEKDFKIQELEEELERFKEFASSQL
jgi:hypothetical protein